MVTSSTESTSALLALSDSLADAVEQAGKSVVAVSARRHVPASGVVWRPDVIVAADHTIEWEDNITVGTADGRSLPAKLAGRDPSTDLAVLRLPDSGLPAAETGDAGTLRIGHLVLAVARPGDAGLSASWGVISALSGPWRTHAGSQVDLLIRPDLTLYPGFSGGPLVDAGGRVAGINTSGLSRNMTLTIPTSTVDRVVEALLNRGHIARGYLGIALQPVQLPEATVQAQQLAGGRALIVVSVESNGPAERAGMLVGDILLALDGHAITESGAVQSVLDGEKIGQSITARILRGGAPAEISLTVGERPWQGEHP